MVIFWSAEVETDLCDAISKRFYETVCQGEGIYVAFVLTRLYFSSIRRLSTPLNLVGIVGPSVAAEARRQDLQTMVHRGAFSEIFGEIAPQSTCPAPCTPPEHRRLRADGGGRRGDRGRG